METTLIEAKGYKNDTIRGLISLPKDYNKDIVAVFIAGFERFGGEPKRRYLKRELEKKGISSLRFDFTGLGDSDGTYENPTIDHCITDLENMISKTIEKYKFQKVTIIGHSVGSCIALKTYDNSDLKTSISKLILLTPALNQAQLTRYWFTINNNKDIDITFENYKQYLNESAYQKSIQSQQIKKANLITSEYSQQMAQANFESMIPEDDTNTMVVFGSRDIVVPRASVQHQFSNEIIINGGDHDLEKPGIIDERVPKVINFIIK